MHTRLLIACVAAAVALPMGATAAMAETQIGGLDLESACNLRAQRSYPGQVDSARAFPTDTRSAYSWVCKIVTYQTPLGSYQEQRGFDTTAVCRWQYGSNSVYAKVGDTRDPNSWKCFKP